MKSNAYILNSHPKAKDFEHFEVWCEWENCEEIPYIKSICSSEIEYKEKILKSRKENNKTYYPILDTITLPDHDFMSIKVKVTTDSGEVLNGCIHTSNNYLSSLRILSTDVEPIEIKTYFSNDKNKERKSIGVCFAPIKYNIEQYSELYFSSKYKLSNGMNINGTFLL